MRWRRRKSPETNAYLALISSVAPSVRARATGVLLPGWASQEGVLVVGARLDVAPDALQHVLAGVDELACPCHCLLVDRVGSHGWILIKRARGDTVQLDSDDFSIRVQDPIVKLTVWAAVESPPTKTSIVVVSMTQSLVAAFQ